MYLIKFGGSGSLFHTLADTVWRITNLQIICKESSLANLKQKKNNRFTSYYYEDAKWISLDSRSLQKIAINIANFFLLYYYYAHFSFEVIFTNWSNRNE